MAGLFAAGVSTTSSGCGGSDEAGTTGTSGTTGNAGTGGGSGGTGGGSACAAPTAALITDFSAAGQVGTPYTFQDTGLTAPTTSTASGALVITVDSGVPTTMYPYLGVGLPFNACVNGSSSGYTGVKFNISGTLTAGCTIQFSPVDKNHSTTANNGNCAAADNCYPAAKVFSLPSAAGDVTVLYSELTGGVGSAGAPIIDPTQILNIQWQISPVGGAAPAACSGTVTIDNITFI
jgi:hypothetical protein